MFLNLVLFALIAVKAVASDVLLPKPGGPYNTVIRTAKLVDHDRLDPFAPTNQSRTLMISLFIPVPASRCGILEPTTYMPPATALLYDTIYGSLGIPNGTFGSFKLQTCSNPSSSSISVGQYPLLIFSPGLGNSRLQYNALVQSIASNGYTVISIDHPYDASIVEFPDGSSILAADIETEAQIELSLATRAEDVSFVLDQLQNPATIKNLPYALRCGSNTNRVGILGHSLGGATALSAMVNDTRLTGGVNLDGSLFGPAIKKGTKRPFLLVGHEGKNQTSDPSWATTWRNLRSWRLELEVAGTTHGSFTDFPLLVDALGLPAEMLKALTNVVGSISGQRNTDIVRVYLSAFFGTVFGGRESRLLVKQSDAYPEVSFVSK
jgi:dienelactone hydrolase